MESMKHAESGRKPGRTLLLDDLAVLRFCCAGLAISAPIYE